MSLRPGTHTERGIASAVIFMMLAIVAAAQVPQTMSFQGELGPGIGANSTQTMTFRIYTTATGGTPIWSETKSVPLDNRRFNVLLGSSTPLAIPFDVQYYIGVTVGNGSEMTPRVKLTSAPYSLRARDADNAATVADGSITTAKLADGAVTDEKVASGISYSKLTGAPSSLPPNGSAGGDLGGSYPNPTVDGLQGRAVSSTAPRDGEFLKWNEPASHWGPAGVNELPAGAVVQTLSQTPPPGYTYTGVSSSFITEGWASRSSSGFTTRVYPAAAVANGKIYVMGGLNGPAFRNANQEYDPATNSWTTKASMPVARFAMGAATVNGKIYLFGGEVLGFVATDTNEEYDPATNSWSAKASMPVARAELSAAAVNGKIYALGGVDASSAIVNTNEEYDPATDTWATKSSSGFTSRYLFAAAAVNGKIYALGGFDGSSAMNTNEEYDPATDTWATKSSSGFTPRWTLAAAAVNGRVYALAGANSTASTLYNTNEEYDPALDIWTTRSSTGFTPRFGPAAAAVNGKIYVMGGGNASFNAVNTNEEYTPPLVLYLHVKQ
jgi:N-acetylneuraminic acid mutarotase